MSVPNASFYPNDELSNVTVEAPSTPLLVRRSSKDREELRRQPSTVILLCMIGLLGVGLFLVVRSSTRVYDESTKTAPMARGQRGVREGVSAKSGPKLGHAYPWTAKLLAWQRTAYHFQPKKNWMNGPLFYKGWYHVFYQYNPYGAVWGNIVWGHAVSSDLINWRHLPVAMIPDQWYDINGVWTGSATFLDNGKLIMLYTGSTNESVQVQNLAYPADSSDPFLIDWVKYSGNPVLVPPPGIDIKDFRDPTTAWKTAEGKWRVAIGSKIKKTGMSLVYETKDFARYELLHDVLHAVPRTGMWECVDFYPVSTSEERGLDTSVTGPKVKHIVKTSLDDDRNDYYAIGTYDTKDGTWSPENPKFDAGIGLRYDYGIFYASKTFYDQEKERRVLWGWIKETDSEETDIKKGWASLQAIPRTVLYDMKTGTNLLQWPVKEVETLRMDKKVFDMEASTGVVVPLDVGPTSQLDIVAEFEVDEEAMKRVDGSDNEYECSRSGGAASRGALGPFGLLVLANKGLTELSPIYFYIYKNEKGNFQTFFCADHSRSSEATDVSKAIYGSTVSVLEGEKLSMRILIDHSIVESFAQGGRTCITSRVYPTKALGNDAQIMLFNNATHANITASLQIWQMGSSAFRNTAVLCVHALVVFVVSIIL
ncbi:beta-fructofuranosidase [Salvia divinorum]